MKIFKYGLPLAALALMASCSNDKLDAPEAGANPGVDQVYPDGTMCMTVNISLPTGAGTKASLEDYAEGTPDEYAVKDITLYVFKMTQSGSNPESDATYIDTLEVGFGDAEDAEDKDDLTKKYTATFQVKPDVWGLNQDGTPVTTGDKFYGLMVVNKPDVFTEPASSTPVNTFNSWNKNAVLSATAEPNAVNVAKSGNYYTMTNAPVVDNAESPASVSTLVEIDPSKFVLSPAQPTLPAATFYVQRIVAKVNVVPSSGVTISDVTVTHNSSDKVSIDNWVLDVTNKYSYPVQNVEAASTWFALNKDYFTASHGDEAITHLWWATDPNYKKSTGEDVNAYYTDAFNLIGATTDVTYVPGADNYAYCLENTMDYDNQNKDQSTRVIFKATYKPGGSALTTEDAGILVFADQAMVVKLTDLKTAAQASTTEIALSDLISESAKKYVKNDDKTLAEAAGDGITEMTALEYFRNALKMANYGQKVAFYKGGETYYTAIIRHFDDSEVDLTAEQKKNVTSNSFAYNENQLGRFGVLRNNAYKVAIKAVQGFGSPTIPDPDGTPDDKEDPKNFNALVDINILNWAVRTYDYTPR